MAEQELFPKPEGGEESKKKVYFVHVKGKNTRKTLSMHEMKDGSHAFVLETRTLQDRKLRHITTTETHWGLQSLTEIQNMITFFLTEPVIKKILNRETGQLRIVTGFSNTDKL